jgi:hypothetical protein
LVAFLLVASGRSDVPLIRLPAALRSMRGGQGGVGLWCRDADEQPAPDMAKPRHC